ncbi:Hpt domain-containing protein [Clostridium sp. AN503]|uniref:Hpt domain-containing protein n=1 Tax=Clostridium sp. AN503 TaxID=3160598 RepID=UPI00345B2283
MQSIQEKMEEYGADYQGTMARFMGNERLYLKVLGKLGDDDNAGKLQAAVAAGDLESAFNAAHTLKGVAANLGLTPLLEAVNDIVEPLRRREQRDDYHVLCDTVEKQFERVVQLVDTLK